jgi:hypothetical protein
MSATAMHSVLRYAEDLGDRVRIVWHPKHGGGEAVGIPVQINDGSWRLVLGSGDRTAAFDLGPRADGMAWVVRVENLDIGDRPEPVPEQTAAPLAAEIRRECEAVRDLLEAKNAAYGNSAIDPVRIFSSASPTEALRVRIDDKLSRLARGSAAGEDTILDLIGYLVLLRIAERKAQEQSP